MTKRIHVEEDTYAAPAALEGDDKSFDDLLSRWLREHQETTESGAGLWAGTDAADSARDARQQMEKGHQ